MRLTGISILLALTVAMAPALAKDKNKEKDAEAAAQIAAAATNSPMQLLEAQFDLMHKSKDEVDHDLGHIDAEFNRHDEYPTSAWFDDSWYPGNYDEGMMWGPGMGLGLQEGPPLPPRKDVLEKWMAHLNTDIQSLSQQAQGVALPSGTPSDLTVQVQVLQGIVPTLQGDYSKLAALLSAPQLDRTQITEQTDRIKDDVSGIDVLRKRVHRLLKDDK